MLLVHFTDQMFTHISWFHTFINVFNNFYFNNKQTGFIAVLKFYPEIFNLLYNTILLLIIDFSGIMANVFF